jgi:hypothetical protein
VKPTSRTDRTRGAFKAREVAQALGLTTPLLAAVETIAYLRGALVIDQPIDGSLARLVRTQKGALIVVSSKLTGGPRRFAIAHELGHHELHNARAALDLCALDQLRTRDSSPEGEANGFAVELLMPRALLDPRCDVKTPSLHHVRQIANEFQVSLLAAGLRFVELTPEPCAIVLCKDGRVDWSMPGPDFRGAPLRGAKVAAEALAYDLFMGRHLQEEPEDVPTEAWLSCRFRGELVEHTMAGPNGSTVTLLWQRQDND